MHIKLCPVLPLITLVKGSYCVFPAMVRVPELKVEESVIVLDCKFVTRFYLPW